MSFFVSRHGTRVNDQGRVERIITLELEPKQADLVATILAEPKSYDLLTTNARTTCGLISGALRRELKELEHS